MIGGKLAERFGPAIGKYAIIAIVVLGLWFSARALFGDIKEWIFGDPEVIRAEAEADTNAEIARTEAEIGQDAGQAIVERHYYHDRVTRVVNDGVAAVRAADDGGKINEEMDAAGAAALCGLHDSLCRPDDQRPASVQ